MIQNEIKSRTVGFVTAAFALVAGLAWNDAIKSLINLLFPLEQDGVIAQFVYAIVLTIVLVLVTMYLSRIFRANEERAENR